MKIRLFITVFCFALIQFQGRAAVMTGNYIIPMGEAGDPVPIIFNYTIVTPSPDYILYFPFMGVPFSIPTNTANVTVNGTSVPVTVTSFSASAGPGIYIKLQDPSLAVAGAQISITSTLRLPTVAGQYPSLGSIKTAASDGTTIDYTTGFSQPFIVIPKRVTFLTTTAITNTSFTANWNSSPGTESYHLDVSTSPTFNTFVTGYSNLNIGTVLTYNVTGLSPNTTYYVRVTSYVQVLSSFNPAPSISVLTLNSSVSSATVSLSNLTATYDGSTHAVTATTIPSGLAVGITYNGSSTVPTNAGTYAVIATVTDANYQGSATGSLVISKATVTPVLGNLTTTYNGSPQTFTATTTPSGLSITKTYDGFSSIPTNAGTYTVSAIVSDANYQGTVTGSLVISKATSNPVLSNLTATYDASTHAAIATTTPTGLTVDITYNGSSTVPTSAGTYAVVATVNNVNYQGSATGSLVISKAATSPVLSNLTATYDGSAHAAIVTTTPTGLTVGITYNGSSTAPTNAGTYAVVATVSDANYQGTATGSLVISKATITPVLGNLTKTYNGSPQVFTVTTTPSNLNITKLYNGFSSIPTNAGTYTVSAIVSDANYQGTVTGSLVISKATITPVLGNLTTTYNGSPQAFTATTTPSGLSIAKTYNGFSSIPTNAGTYAVVATVSDVNYQGTATGTLVISKVTVNPVLSNLTATYNGSSHPVIATTTPSNLNITITYDGSSTIPVEVGSYAVVATIDDVNYQGSVTGTLTITSIATGITGKVLTDIKLFPNPCKEFVNVDANVSEVKTIRILNTEGVTVIQKDNCMQQERLDVSMLAKGVYVVIVDAESGRGSYRLIIY